jgi:hypothetical protein
MIKVKAFQCEFCRRKVIMNKTHMADHERMCFKNPARRACQTCGNVNEETECEYEGHRFGEATYGAGSTTRWCEAKEKDINDMHISDTCDCIRWKPMK